ncbi:MAG: rhodanese-like domain-containing protein [Gammaproteobacteria bacterium]|nr:rhodanese-like domain-containing protein [Gammaproteobacteria bacterium]
MFKGQYKLLQVLVVATPLLISACDNNTGLQQGQMLVQTARSIEKAETAISIDTLSDRIIKRQNDYQLFDVRPQADFNKGHIKTAKSVSGTELLSEQGIQGLNNGRQVYLYSGSSGRAAQLAILLRLQGVPAYYLSGGYSAWSRQMTNATNDPDKSATELARQQAVSCWFEGDYVPAAGLAVKTTAGGGYVPPLEPVQAAEEEDSLGLGLGLGLGPEGDLAPAPQATGGTLRIGEGC